MAQSVPSTGKLGAVAATTRRRTCHNHRPEPILTEAWRAVRKQYHFQPGASRLDAWDVDRLVALTRGLPVKQVPLAAIWELDTVYWSETMTPRQVAVHVGLTNAVDVQYPIILGADGRVMDGMHRVLRALLEGRESIDAVQFDTDPAPDYLDVTPDELPYPGDGLA